MFTQVQMKCVVFWFVSSYCSISGYHLSKPTITLSSYRIFTQLINRSINKSEVVYDFVCWRWKCWWKWCLQVNAFEVGQEGVSIRALYPQAFYMAHDCVPNTGHTDDKNFRLRVKVSTKIHKGSPIYLSYAYTFQVGTGMARGMIFIHSFYGLSHDMFIAYYKLSSP